MDSRPVTYEQLLYWGACTDYRKLFLDKFNDNSSIDVDPEDIRVQVTVELAVSQALEWDWQWAAEYLLSAEGEREWNALTEEADRAFEVTMRPFYEAVDDAMAKGMNAYNDAIQKFPRNEWGGTTPEARQAARRAQEPFTVAARQARDEAYKPARLAREQAHAKVWAEIYIKEGSTNG